MGFVLLVGVVIAAWSGCTHRPITGVQQWSYIAATPAVPPEQALTRLRVVVRPFVDVRRPLAEDTRRHGLYILPLWPYDSFTLHRPDELAREAARERPDEVVASLDFPKDFAAALAAELANAGLFAEVRFDPTGTLNAGYDFVIGGELRKTEAYESKTAYLASIYGMALYVTGLPYGSASWNVDLDVSLVELASGRTLWHDHAARTEKRIRGLYYNRDALDRCLALVGPCYGRLLRFVTGRVVANLRTALRQDPQLVAAADRAANRPAEAHAVPGAAPALGPGAAAPSAPGGAPPAAPPPAPLVGLRGRLAVLELLPTPDVAADVAAYLTDLVRGEAARLLPQMDIITRENLLVLLDANKVSLAACEGECEVETGRLIGADILVSGEMLHLGGEPRVVLKLHNVAEGRLIGAERAGAAEIRGLEAALEAAAGRLLLRLAPAH